MRPLECLTPISNKTSPKFQKCRSKSGTPKRHQTQVFAYMIWEGFRIAAWPASEPIPIPELPPQLRRMTRTGASGGGPNGVTVVIPSDADRQPSGEPLMNALGKNNEYGAWISINPAIPLPPGTFRIVVSSKPDPRIEYTPTTRPAKKPPDNPIAHSSPE